MIEDLRWIRYLAVKHKWNKSLHIKQKCFISFKKKPGKIMRIYYDVMTVYTDIPHSRYFGKFRTLRRQNVSMEELDEIFKNPRYHSGKGKYLKDIKKEMAMNLLPKLSKRKCMPVEKYRDIKADALVIIDLIDVGKFSGRHKEAMAIAHPQVSNDPCTFFVAHKKLVQDKILPHQVIINPRIVSRSEDRFIHEEGCMSFPFRENKKVLRYGRVTVKFFYPKYFGMVEVEKEFAGIISAMFQHEVEHLNSNTIYDK